MTVQPTLRIAQRPALWRIAGFGGAALLFGLLLIAVRLRWVPLVSVDKGLDEALNDAVAPNHGLVTLFKTISLLGSHGVLYWLLAIAAVLLLVRKRFRLALFLVAANVGAMILDPTLKAAVGRLRPVVDQPVAVGGGNSFPSGHALDSLVAYGSLALIFLPALRPKWRRPVLISLGALVLLIGFSRIALGVHFLSDVFGAWALGTAWLGITAAAFELQRAGQGTRVTEPLQEGLEPEAAADLRPTGPPISVQVMRSGWAIAGSAVTWVLVFGVLIALGIPLAKYHKGNGNILGDHTIPHWFAAHRSHLLDRISIIGSEVGNTHAILAIGLATGAVALGVIRRWRPVVFLLTVMFGELTLFLAAAAVVGRARPDVANLDGKMPTSSFPSGHVAATICVWTVIAVIAFPRIHAWWRWLPVALVVAMPIWVAVSRMYRGMHHPTDILGSIILAGLWVTAMVYFIRPNCDLEKQ